MNSLALTRALALHPLPLSVYICSTADILNIQARICSHPYPLLTHTHTRNGRLGLKPSAQAVSVKHVDHGRILFFKEKREMCGRVRTGEGGVGRHMSTEFRCVCCVCFCLRVSVCVPATMLALAEPPAMRDISPNTCEKFKYEERVRKIQSYSRVCKCGTCACARACARVCTHTDTGQWLRLYTVYLSGLKYGNGTAVR
jgi:hypothetical protein